MDYKDFTDRDTAFNNFVKYRRAVIDSIEEGKFFDEFFELCAKGMSGDCIAQDCIAYFFNKGIDELLPANYDYYMCWEILAGANGNEFALEKLNFFIDPAVNTIVYEDGLLVEAMKRGNLTKDNALPVIQNLICEAIADILQLDPKNLIDLKYKESTYTPAKGRKYVDAMERSVEAVAGYLLS